MIARLWSSTVKPWSPLAAICSTGTVPLAEACKSSGGLARRATSRNSRSSPGRKPAASRASRARIA